MLEICCYQLLSVSATNVLLSQFYAFRVAIGGGGGGVESAKFEVFFLYQNCGFRSCNVIGNVGIYL